MKLKEFNQETVPPAPIRGSSNVPTIALNQKSGLFRINKAACELLSLKPGESIVFHQDEEDEVCWYLEKVKGRGFELNEKKSVSGGLIFSNIQMVKSIFDSMNFIGLSGKVLIAGQPTIIDKRKFWGLLTNLLKNE